MNVKYTAFPETGAAIVYIRAVSVADLPGDVQDQAKGLNTLYAVYRPDGARLALVRDRDMAFALAEQNDMTPVSVH